MHVWLYHFTWDQWAFHVNPCKPISYPFFFFLIICKSLLKERWARWIIILTSCWKSRGKIILIENQRHIGINSKSSSFMSYFIARSPNPSKINRNKKKQKKKRCNAKMLSMVVWMDQEGRNFGSTRASKQSFASPSTITWLHLSYFASSIAQKIVSNSAWIGDVNLITLAHILIGMPRWSLAITTMEAWDLVTGASTLILSHPRGGRGPFL